MDRRLRPRGPARRYGAAGIVLTVVALGATSCGNDDPPPPDLASPSAACSEAFAAAAESAERSDPESPRNPDLDALHETLDACSSADEWLTAVRGNPSALPLELDRETALDQLCGRNEGTAVCESWAGTSGGPTD